MAVNDIYLVEQSISYGSSVFINAFTFKASNSNATAQLIAETFHDQYTPKILGIISAAATELTVYAQNENSSTDFYTFIPTTPANGARPTPEGNSVLAAGFFAPSSNKQIRQGSKRFSPLAAADMIGNTLSGSSAFETALNTLAAQMIQPLVTLAEGIFAQHIIVKREAYTTPNGNTAYRLPKVATATNHYVVSEWGYKPITATQTSRKSGRGS